jgi:hypothetical protein
VKNLTSRHLDVLVFVERDSARTLGRQIEDQLRNAIRELAAAAVRRPGSLVLPAFTLLDLHDANPH